MKRDKELQKIADSSLAEYHNEEVSRELKAVIKSNKDRVTNSSHKRRKLTILSLVSSATLAAVAVIVVCICLPIINKPIEEKNYGVGNRIFKVSDVNVLNADLTYFSVYISDPDAIVFKAIDEYYNETLYYSIDINYYDTGEMIELVVVTNKDFKYPFDYANNNTYDRKQSIGNYILTYSENLEFIEQDLYYVQTYGELVTDKEMFYFSYNGFVFEESTNFVNYVQQIITVK